MNHSYFAALFILCKMAPIFESGDETMVLLLKPCIYVALLDLFLMVLTDSILENSDPSNLRELT